MISTLAVSICLLSYSSALLTHEMCAARLDTVRLVEEANKIADTADFLLVPSRFSRVEKGYLIMVADEGNGTFDGGGTNTDGSCKHQNE